MAGMVILLYLWLLVLGSFVSYGRVLLFTLRVLVIDEFLVNTARLGGVGCGMECVIWCFCVG